MSPSPTHWTRERWGRGAYAMSAAATTPPRHPPLGVEPGLPRQDQEGSQEAEECPGRPDRRAVLEAQEQDQHRRREPADHVDGEEAGPADDALERRSEEEEGEHVERDVPDLH